MGGLKVVAQRVALILWLRKSSQIQAPMGIRISPLHDMDPSLKMIQQILPIKGSFGAPVL